MLLVRAQSRQLIQKNTQKTRQKKEIFITIVRAGVLYGYMESYEITDPKVRAELIELFKKAWKEEEKIRQRFKNNG